MQSNLKEIQEYVIQYAELIEKVTKLDVEIVDQNLLRIAGTGAIKNELSKNMAEHGHIYEEVIKNGFAYYIENPGIHPLCQSCSNRNNCDEYAELNAPIMLDGEIIGVIGLICYTQDQKDKLVENLDVYREFVLHIASFISGKAFEQRENNRLALLMEVLNQVIGVVDEGILVFDDAGNIKHSNKAACKQLNMVECVGKRIEIKPTGDKVFGGNEYNLMIGTKKFQIIGQLIPGTAHLSEYAHILKFNNIRKVKSGIYNLTNINPQQGVEKILGNTPEMIELKNQIIKIADSNSTVLITGESGTGKDLVARAIHYEGNRHDKPFVSINCGAIPDTLLESELFGYVKGAFTGADPNGKIGKFEIANKGIVFLDEIGDMPLYLQVKLLRVLQEKKFSRIGSNQIIELDVRVIAATNRDLKELITEKKFRSDLYYRLNVIPLHVLPLRDRTDDIEILVDQLLMKYCRLFEKPCIGIDNKAMNILKLYSWPGNVRELENTVEFMINMAENVDMLSTEEIPDNILKQEGHEKEITTETEIPLLRDIEKQQILRAIAICGTDTLGKHMAAKRLGISVATLYRKLEKYNS